MAIAQGGIVRRRGPMTKVYIPTILAIDPGTDLSAYVVLSNGRPTLKGKFPNWKLLEWLRQGTIQPYDHLCVEKIASYGMAVGKEVFETCVWSGRFIEASGKPFSRLTRKEVVVHCCGSSKAKDTNVRTAMIDKYGPPGTKKNPGGTYGFANDTWAALAVATACWELKTYERPED